MRVEHKRRASSGPSKGARQSQWLTLPDGSRPRAPKRAERETRGIMNGRPQRALFGGHSTRVSATDCGSVDGGSSPPGHPALRRVCHRQRLLSDPVAIICSVGPRGRGLGPSPLPATLARVLPSARLLRWYARHRRDLPWRRTRDAYRILVSEVMLQQTQVARVLPAYAAFLKRFPSLAALARASLADALRAWSGLGYNRRARDLHRIARLRPRGLPRTAAALDALPGVGAYTAAAVACFAHDDDGPFADTNIRRVLGRVFLGRVATEREATRLDATHLPRGRAAAWHHALMDVGATICTRRAPRCVSCPLRPDCLAQGEGTVAPRRRQAPFATSDRRVRGLIVEVLRRVPAGLTLAQLRRRVEDARAARLVATLVAEGLVERGAGRVRLPA